MPATIFSIECNVPAIASLPPFACPTPKLVGVERDCGEKMLGVAVGVAGVEALDTPNAAAIAAA